MNKITAVDLRFLCLAAMLVFLPGVEALKNIFAFLFVLSWILISKKNNNWGGKWKIIDSIFFLWILADIFVSVNAVITHQLPGSNFRDVIRFVLIAWVLSRIYFPKDKLFELALIAVIATVITLGYSYYSTGGILKELHSVGHINHTAIFLAIAYSISLSLLLFDFNNLKKFQKIILLLSTIVLFSATIDTGSRASFGLIIIITLVYFIYLLIKYRKFTSFLLFIGLVSSVGVFFILNPPKALERIQSNDHILQDETRDRIRNFSYYAFKKNPLFGIGFGNYGGIKIEDIKSEIIKDKGVFDSKLYLPGSHAHNVFYTYLVSGGLLIFSIFIWFWLYIVWIIFKLRSAKENDWIVLSSIGVSLINLGIGWVNTTLHHEHAILSMFVLGMLISEYRRAENNKILH
jgi:O-antigen ligase